MDRIAGRTSVKNQTSKRSKGLSATRAGQQQNWDGTHLRSRSAYDDGGFRLRRSNSPRDGGGFRTDIKHGGHFENIIVSVS